MLALKMALEHLQPLLDACTHVPIWRTDNRTASAFQRCELEGKSKVMREFVMKMQGVPLKIELIKGAKNSVADAVSRFHNYVSDPVEINMLETPVTLASTATTPVTSPPSPSAPSTPTLIVQRPYPPVSLEVPRGEPRSLATTEPMTGAAERPHAEGLLGRGVRQAGAAGRGDDEAERRHAARAARQAT